MIWRFRRELLLCLLLVVCLLILRRGQWQNSFFSLRGMNGSEIHLNSEELLRENRRLRRLLHLQEKKLSPFSSVVTAEVVKIQPSVWPGQLLVNKGSRDGVKPNMVVVSPEGSLIGRVIETGETTATVFTLFHPSTKISVMVQSTREIGVLEGASLPYLLVRYLPRESHVQPGDTVITSGLSDYYPKGLVVGRIYRAVTEKNQFFLVAWVKPEAGFSQLDEVLLAR